MDKKADVYVGINDGLGWGRGSRNRKMDGFKYI
jgi:hypothetical protein